MLIHDEFYCEGYFYYNQFGNILNQLTQRQNVEFALYCAKDVFHLNHDEYDEDAILCIDLVEKWLKDESSVTSKELRNVSHAAYIADHVAANAAGNAAWAASHTANARNATSAAAYAILAWTNTNNKLNEYLVVANSYLTKTTTNCPNYEIEGKILYLIDELDENIFIKVEDKYYVNMNGIENCPEYGFDTQQELLNELLNSKDQFWEYTRNWLDQLYKEPTSLGAL